MFVVKLRGWMDGHMKVTIGFLIMAVLWKPREGDKGMKKLEKPLCSPSYSLHLQSCYTQTFTVVHLLCSFSNFSHFTQIKNIKGS